VSEGDEQKPMMSGAQVMSKARKMLAAMDGLDVSTLQDEAVRSDLAKEYLATRRFYAKTAIIITTLVCITLTLAFLIFGNQVKPSTIEACRVACQSSGSIMQEATSQKCTCLNVQQE